MSEHADTIRVALRPGMTAGEALAALAALDALEADLAEARRERDEAREVLDGSHARGSGLTATYDPGSEGDTA